MGYPHPDYLLEQLTATQLSEWEAYDKLDPIGKWRDELMIASVCSLITNITRQLHTKKGYKVEFTTPDDFIIKWGEFEEQKPEPKKQTQEEMANVLQSLVSMHGTTDKIKKK